MKIVTVLYLQMLLREGLTISSVNLVNYKCMSLAASDYVVGAYTRSNVRTRKAAN